MKTKITDLITWVLLLVLAGLAVGLGMSLAEREGADRYGALMDSLRQERRWNAARAELIERLGRELAEARGNRQP